MQDFRKLHVMPFVRRLIVLTYRTTKSFPREERFGVVAQMRKAAWSIGANIAEGCGRSSNAAFRAGLDRAKGESSELEFHCEASLDMEFGIRAEVEHLLAETIRVSKMLAKLIVVVRQRHPDDDEGRRQRPNVPATVPRSTSPRADM